MKEEQYSDLYLFEKEYRYKIKKFLNSNFETRIVFLNADFGWGKTTFIKKFLRVSEENIYSPWLNESDDFLEDIYYHVKKKNKGIESSKVIFLTFLAALGSILIGSIIDILIPLFTDCSFICELIPFSNFDCINFFENFNGGLVFLLLMFFLFFVFIITYVVDIFFTRPIPFISLFKKESGKYYEDKIIKEIVDSFDGVLVIEDLDRVNKIEEILIVINKISEYIINNNLNKYILITGDYIRMNRRIGDPKSYGNRNSTFDLNDKGPYIIEKVVSLKIEFPSIEKRVLNILNEFNLKLKKIEQDEIVNFIKTRYLSVRFFVRFLESYKKKILGGMSLFHLLIEYYQEEKFLNINSNALENSVFNISRFPNSLNDFEMVLQKKVVKINKNEYTSETLKNIVRRETSYSIINSEFSKILFGREKARRLIFKDFFHNNFYPRLSSDRPSSSNGLYSIGMSMKPNGIINNVVKFLIGDSNNEFEEEDILKNKRCYFEARSSNDNINFYKIKEQYVNNTKIVDEKYFITAYFACFFRDNKEEMIKNYPRIWKKISNIVK